MTDLITVERSDAIFTIRFNRPERKNALTRAMYTGANEALDRAASDDSVRVVVFDGAGDSFCAGNDLMDFANDPPTGKDSPVFHFLTRLVDFPKPIVVAVHGAAVGIGTTMLLHCDFAYADTSAKFKMPFVPLGLVPEAGSSLLLTRALGQRRASELLMLGGTFSASVAQEAGLINEVVHEGAHLSAAMERAGQLASLPPKALAETKHLLRMHDREEVLNAIAVEGEVFTQRLASPECAEAIQAFFQKRKPDFSEANLAKHRR